MKVCQVYAKSDTQQEMMLKKGQKNYIPQEYHILFKYIMLARFKMANT